MRITQLRDPSIHREKLVEHLGERTRGFVEILESHNMLTGNLELDMVLTAARLDGLLEAARKPKKPIGAKPPAEPERGSVDVDFMYPKGIEIPQEAPDPEFDPLAHVEYGAQLSPEAEAELEALSDPRNTCVVELKKDTNTKLKHMHVVTYNLPAGYTCPGAGVCRQWVHKHRKEFPGTDSILKKADDAKFYCFAARLEHIRKNYQAMGWRNFDLLRAAKSKDQIVEILIRSIKVWEEKNGPIKVFRLSEGGDIFSQDFFDAWINVANMRSDILFYGYTTSIHFWEPNVSRMPKNLRMTASLGGEHDEIVHKHGLRNSVVAYSLDHAKKLGRPVDIDDSYAAFGDKDFALLVHGGAVKDNKKLYHQIEQNKKDIKPLLRKATAYWTSKKLDTARKRYTS